MRTPIRQDAKPFSPEQTERYKADFNRDGFLHIPDVLEPDEVAALKAGIDRLFADSKWKETKNVQSDFIGLRLFETDPVFEDLLTREPLIGLMESILGPDCHIIAQNALRNAPGQAIDTFHVDDTVIVPIGEGMARHDPRLPMPAFIINCTFALTDIPSDEYGPTQYVPGSHYAGRQPDDPKNPVFEGKGPVSILCKAGDMYMFNNQGWHRGAPNTSDRTRCICGMAFGRRWIAQRFFPFANYQIPPHVLERADERRRRVLGFHASGAYG
ncbi:MAG TPA: phytanoyl-CoA dioxygenase family protein [Abditibacteriaceae bacterium]|nr:phytanoyl-CoA dioxygenase family protein [Abditibacteriaceae bacterium]